MTGNFFKYLDWQLFSKYLAIGHFWKKHAKQIKIVPLDSLFSIILVAFLAMYLFPPDGVI